MAQMMAETEGTLWPRDESELRSRFDAEGFEPEEIPHRSQAKALLRLLQLYEMRGLAPATRPLCDCCENARSCWRAAIEARRVPGGELPEDGGIILPWVGAGYGQGGVIVIALNPNIAVGDRTYLLSEHEISWDRHHRVLESGMMSDGR